MLSSGLLLDVTRGAGIPSILTSRPGRKRVAQIPLQLELHGYSLGGVGRGGVGSSHYFGSFHLPFLDDSRMCHLLGPFTFLPSPALPVSLFHSILKAQT